jgi:hypothetical protein
MSISRRTALATGAAAITTGAIAAPLALKAANVKAALAGEPVLPAYEAFEAARLKSIAMSDHRLAVVEAVEAELPPEPHRNRTYLELSPTECDEAAEWRGLCNRRVTARLGMDEDSFMDIYYDRTMLAYEAVVDIRATTVAGLLCQVRAWWSTYEGHKNIQITLNCLGFELAAPCV